DREHWAWKFRDFPINMLQTGMVPMAMLYAARPGDSPYAGEPRMLQWTLAAVRATLNRQHRNGSFDSVAPYSQDHGVTLQLVLALAATLRILGASAGQDVHAEVARAVRRACAFAEQSVEDYAFISNHHAFFALAWHYAGELLGDSTLTARGSATVNAILARQSSDGWYEEYGGPDPGYESLGIAYLAQYLAATHHAGLAESLERSLEFFAHCVHPDGSVGGSYGSRLTHLWYPAGFELLAAGSPRAAAIAAFLRDRLGRLNVVTPDSVDAHNLPSMLLSYLLAADARRHSSAPADPQILPCESRHLWRHFNESGVTVAATPHYYAVTNARHGGVLSICDRRSERLVYDDSGLIVQSGCATWCSATPAAVERIETSADSFTATSVVRLGSSANTPLTPGKFLILRILGLTAFRSVALGRRIRRLVIARLITARKAGPLTYERSITFRDASIAISDRLAGRLASGIRGIRLTRDFQPFHMGSARYFHQRDLSETPVVDTAPGAHGPGAREWFGGLRSEVRWSAAGEVSCTRDSVL
ncbi:MAG: hypothetical protein ACT4R6_08165, partial [Gemmatimonadaceae bacterium]